MTTLRLIGQWLFTMTVALGVAIGLAFIWGICSVSVLIEDIKR